MRSNEEYTMAWTGGILLTELDCNDSADGDAGFCIAAVMGASSNLKQNHSKYLMMMAQICAICSSEYPLSLNHDNLRLGHSAEKT